MHLAIVGKDLTHGPPARLDDCVGIDHGPTESTPRCEQRGLPDPIKPTSRGVGPLRSHAGLTERTAERLALRTNSTANRRELALRLGGDNEGGPSSRRPHPCRDSGDVGALLELTSILW